MNKPSKEWFPGKGRRIALDSNSKTTVSTVLIWIAYYFQYESLVISADSKWDGYIETCQTEKEAKKMHKRICKRTNVFTNL